MNTLFERSTTNYKDEWLTDPRTFQYARIQTIVLHLDRRYRGATEFKVFDLL